MSKSKNILKKVVELSTGEECEVQVTVTAHRRSEYVWAEGPPMGKLSIPDGKLLVDAEAELRSQAMAEGADYEQARRAAMNKLLTADMLEVEGL